MNVLRVLLGLCFLVVTTGSAWAQKVSYDYAKGTDFSKYKTFAWAEGTHVQDPLVHARIIGEVEAQLAKKGLTKTESNPDLYVVYHVAFDTQKDISTFSSGYGYGGYGWGWGGGWGTGTTTTTVRDIVVGTLVLDMADAAQKQVVWRGIATKTGVDVQAKPEKRDKNIRKGAEKLLKNFPPPAK
jgi:hypothetical protein